MVETRVSSSSAPQREVRAYIEDNTAAAPSLQAASYCEAAPAISIIAHCSPKPDPDISDIDDDEFYAMIDELPSSDAEDDAPASNMTENLETEGDEVMGPVVTSLVLSPAAADKEAPTAAAKYKNRAAGTKTIGVSSQPSFQEAHAPSLQATSYFEANPAISGACTLHSGHSEPTLSFNEDEMVATLISIPSVQALEKEFFSDGLNPLGLDLDEKLPSENPDNKDEAYPPHFADKKSLSHTMHLAGVKCAATEARQKQSKVE